MDEADLTYRVARFERTVAICLCVVPLLFSGQCFFIALEAPTFAAMYKDFGSKLPWPTQMALNGWPVFLAISLIFPATAFLVARSTSARISVIVSTILGIAMFVVAQFLTLALFLPILQLGAVAGGL